MHLSGAVKKYLDISEKFTNQCCLLFTLAKSYSEINPRRQTCFLVNLFFKRWGFFCFVFLFLFLFFPPLVSWFAWSYNDSKNIAFLIFILRSGFFFFLSSCESTRRHQYSK